MRIGLIADIHGNLFALDAVLAALARIGMDELICLGDVAALGPQPREVIERLRALRCPVVMGNTDAWHLDPALAEGSSAPVLAICPVVRGATHSGRSRLRAHVLTDCCTHAAGRHDAPLRPRLSALVRRRDHGDDTG